MDQSVKMMKCGCAAVGKHMNEHDSLASGHPTCITHSCCEVVDAPDLAGRVAKCAECPKTTPSDMTLAFFAHKPTAGYDNFYCGCHGWD